MWQVRPLERIKFLIERQFIKGAHMHLLAVAALIGIVSVIGSILVLPASDASQGYGDTLWWAFLRLTDPGYLGDDNGAWRRFISTLLTVAGYVLFMGSLVAIMTQWLNQKLRRLEQGLTSVAASNHVVILGWTSRTVPVVVELLLSAGRLRRFLRRHGTARLQLVILAEEVTPAHSHELAEEPQIGPLARDIILRSGSALDIDDLERTDCLNAAAVILPSRSWQTESLITADVESIKAMMSLSSMAAAAGRTPPYLVAEIQDLNKMALARRAYRGPLEVIASDAAISRLMAQNLRHPGLSAAYSELLNRGDGNEFYLRPVADMVGNTVRQIRIRFPRAILCGVVAKEGREFVPRLNLPEKYRIREGDRLVLIARGFTDTEPEDFRPEVKGPPVPAAPHAPAEPHPLRRLLILGWNHKIPALIAELGSYLNERFNVDLVSTTSTEMRARAIAQYGGLPAHLELRQIEADYIVRSELLSINPAAYDSVLMVTSDRSPSGEEADARTIVGHLLLEELLADSSRRPRVLMELADPHNETFLGRGHSEIILSPLILSHMLAQVALRRELRTLFEELFTAGGPEMMLSPVQAYQCAPGAAEFAKLEDQVRAAGDTLLGIAHFNNSASLPEMQINPPRDQTVTLGDEDQFLVLTTLDVSPELPG